jgi:hypothetical protein
MYCSILEMYSCCRSCWIAILLLSTHVFWEAIIETSKIHNLFIEYPNITYYSVLTLAELQAYSKDISETIYIR